MSRWRREEGNGTVTGLLLVAVALLAAGCVLLFLAAGQAATRAGTAADLAALAAADTARGLRSGSACAVAAEISQANGAVLRECTVEPTGDTVRLVVGVDVRFSFAGMTLYQAAASARAGPPQLN
ncbi:hypothetical protein OK351_00585 [Glutamicibacter sp. MNS18]|uniref:Rv3654c family TadE-like protein n=1 Tax=Glutamicibacter sp. MNS18 TaxID=2989817 RepID=UPI002235C41C|nr:Rv3654c family TadE-like protein [Glutamicibacter sp. MNS18]MCW4464012.1 hypothetical protein [Glutamicibacter sp. MNS18]